MVVEGLEVMAVEEEVRLNNADENVGDGVEEDNPINQTAKKPRNSRTVDAAIPNSVSPRIFSVRLRREFGAQAKCPTARKPTE
jgi:hypothetical protein